MLEKSCEMRDVKKLKNGRGKNVITLRQNNRNQTTKDNLNFSIFCCKFETYLSYKKIPKSDYRDKKNFFEKSKNPFLEKI